MCFLIAEKQYPSKDHSKAQGNKKSKIQILEHEKQKSKAQGVTLRITKQNHYTAQDKTKKNRLFEFLIAIVGGSHATITVFTTSSFEFRLLVRESLDMCSECILCFGSFNGH
jgi:hypothetical protein